MSDNIFIGSFVRVTGWGDGKLIAVTERGFYIVERNIPEANTTLRIMKRKPIPVHYDGYRIRGGFRREQLTLIKSVAAPYTTEVKAMTYLAGKQAVAVKGQFAETSIRRALLSGDVRVTLTIIWQRHVSGHPLVSTLCRVVVGQDLRRLSIPALPAGRAKIEILPQPERVADAERKAA